LTTEVIEGEELQEFLNQAQMVWSILINGREELT
jgi:hypothetical protein